MHENKLMFKEQCSEENKKKVMDDFDYLAVYDPKGKKPNKIQIG